MHAKKCSACECQKCKKLVEQLFCTCWKFYNAVCKTKHAKTCGCPLDTEILVVSHSE